MAVAQLEDQMRAAAKSFEFERAAALRDRIRGLKQRNLDIIETTELPLDSGKDPGQSPKVSSTGNR
jgi:UvrB/uvrC motif